MTELMIKSVQYIVLVIAAAWLMGKALQRLQLSLAKSPSLGGHLRWAKRIAGWIQGYAYDPKRWFHIDGADEQIQQMRRQALARLGEDLRVRSEVTLRYSNVAKPMLPDLQFISNYRVPFQFREVLQQHIALGSFWKSSDGVWLTDPDGNRYIDVTGSYGVNVFGQDFYKDCIAQGGELVQDLGPVLGSYHPCVLDNLERLQKISGKEQFTFHMSGTEAVMQAVRVARYTTGKKKIVRFTSAYHGWWDDVQPGPGNPMPPSRHTLTLREMHANTLRVLRNRKDIACVLVNPIQAMHPNRVAPTDSTLVTGGRRTNYDRQAYTSWLKELRQVCTEKGILLIMDEIFLGFRLAPRGAQQFFDVKADLITYGKTIAGGLPIGVVCGNADVMTRFHNDRPADICFARGTFKEHPYVMGAMNAFLRSIESKEIKTLYSDLDATWSMRMHKLNQLFKTEGLPLHVDGLSTVWAVSFDVPSCYNWMLQFYLRREGIALSWVGTGRMIFSLSFTDEDFEQFCQRFIRAAHQMATDGWWWTPEGQTNKRIRQRILMEMLKRRFR